MKNYLWEDADTGNLFYVQADSFEEAQYLVNEEIYCGEDCHFTGEIHDDWEAEFHGYDTV
jgi:hypothetical protein